MSIDRRIWSLRGAVNLELVDRDQMVSRIGQLLSQLIEGNDMSASDIVSIQFTQTEDIDFLNAAQAARMGIKGKTIFGIPLFCSMEPRYPESMKLTIRIMITYYHSVEHLPRPVYLYETQSLRKELIDFSYK